MITKERILEIQKMFQSSRSGGASASQDMLHRHIVEVCSHAVKGLAAEKLEKACQFYADINNYDPHESSIVTWEAREEYVGEKASRALAEYRKEIENE